MEFDCYNGYHYLALLVSYFNNHKDIKRTSQDGDCVDDVVCCDGESVNFGMLFVCRKFIVLC